MSQHHAFHTGAEESMSVPRKCIMAALLTVLAAAPILSCAPAARLSPAEEREQRQRFWQSRFRPVTYRLAEPDAGALNERISVRDDGVLEMSGRLFGTALAQLPPEEVALRWSTRS
jgi:hypothetical protein